jgi:Ca2+-binding RTX toxin-like protein
MQPPVRRGRRAAPVAAAAALITYVLGLGFIGAGSAHGIGGLCNGAPASHSWLDASGQPGPTLIEGTDGDDVIVGGDGDDNIDGAGGDDWICGGPGDDSLEGGHGNDVVIGGTGDDGPSGGPGNDTVDGGPGDDDPEGGPGHDVLIGGPGDDWMKSNDDDEADKVYAGDGFDICFFSAGDELVDCEY